MRPGLGLGQVVAGAPGDHVLLVGDEVSQHGLEPHEHGLALGNGHHVHPEGDLQIAVLVQECQHPLGVGVLFQLDHRPHARAVALVPDVIDAAEGAFLLLGELEDLLQHGGFVDLVGDLRNDQQLAPGKAVLHVHPGPQGELALARFVGLADLLGVQQHAPGGKVRAGQARYEPVQGNVRVFHERHGGVDGLPQVVGGNIGG